MPSFTYTPDTVLIEATGELAVGATGVFRDQAGGVEQPIFDLNGNPIPNVVVGPAGAHQAFKAARAFGVLDFGSAQLVKVSAEAYEAAIDAQQTADQAVADVQTALAQVNLIREQIGTGKGLLVLPVGQEPDPATTVDFTVIFEYQPPAGPTPVESAG